MKKKSWLILLLSAMLVLSACGSGSGDESKEGKDGGLKLGLVTDTGGINDESFNQTAWEGMKQAEKELGAEVKYLESNKDSDYIPNLTKLIRGDYDLTWGIGFKFEEAMRDISDQFPDAKLGIVDTNMGGNIPDNVVAVTFKEHEGSFLMGVIAGATTKTDKVGFIGGIESELIKKFEAGYRAGVHAVNPDAEVKVAYAASFTDTAKGRSLAKSMYNDNTDVIYHAAGGVGKGLFSEVKTREQGKFWAIGVDMDQSSLAPNHTLSSMIKKVDVAVYDVAASLDKGTFEGGKEVVLGLEDDAVGIATTSNKNTPDDVLKKVDEYRNKIIDGEVKVPATIEELEEFMK
ncbi:BMP family protein [Mechercharimyces sp. CAU 1602]|uniref:BMP family lipoprotein n=1 Tax=Mechercharimyces sp. CAU 1602 TaxID=2973933 RepID=UPI002162AE34|nr:BMP family ABC transporter substrate-binding protein [Mechercharimyces sp. CAU 1602]MCS1351249.1 BMP family ABC transporter substrate-binding protein [Mechercharimyces sp. CAU 1602]